ncbi:acetylornithine deacetylase or succinyl-diaminopimelate desuccinylase [Alkaliphilus metalliredigens QYMF]|uniref:Acetylornithine deacetylase or succinyl-diaminopimelate desuccinylase n=1 Tax=Alkaliphilus metalliredigens (strain QYMF) TaxID=293826 RepID=A6TL17_ALKMQ|nr:M20 family metallopeptidase [Alkaliphilus metalliredigens]ABR46885.1 acetylornithine deacetylase or succinyl-diaminopimelate desuccinylase [Alkaliphilus metalliredigens QYMF]
MAVEKTKKLSEYSNAFQGFVSSAEVVELTKTLISIEGHKEVETQELEIALWIHQYFEERGIESFMEMVETNRPNVYACINGDEDEVALMLSGHTDTIPGFQMNYEPFEPFVKDGKLYGRGSVDMKGGIAAMMVALLAIKRGKIPLKKSVVFAGVIDEEQASKGTEDIIKSGNMKPALVVIGEPTQLNVAIAHKGMEWIEVTFKGKAGHGSRPYEGINALYTATCFIEMIRKELAPKIEKKTYALLRNGTINVGVIAGGDDPNIIPDKCVVKIDRRWLPSETLEGIYEELKELAERAVSEVGGSFSMRSMEEETASLKNTPHAIDEAHPLVIEALKVVEEVTGKKTKATDFPGWSDAALLSRHLGTEGIVLGPGNIQQAHANDEFCSIAEIYQAAEIYYRLIIKFCCE